MGWPGDSITIASTASAMIGALNRSPAPAAAMSIVRRSISGRLVRALRGARVVAGGSSGPLGRLPAGGSSAAQPVPQAGGGRGGGEDVVARDQQDPPGQGAGEHRRRGERQLEGEEHHGERALSEQGGAGGQGGHGQGRRGGGQP